MIHLPASVRVYLCLTACDMRKSFDGLHQLVRDYLALDAFAGHLFHCLLDCTRCGPGEPASAGYSPLPPFKWKTVRVDRTSGDLR